MSLKFTVVDAFTTKPFGGNPAAVVILPFGTEYEDRLLQDIAGELNLPATAFVQMPKKVGYKDKGSTGSGVVTDNGQPQPQEALFGLRWFTPTKEISLCGHGSIATCAILFADTTLFSSSSHEIRFSTLYGTVAAKRIIADTSPADAKYELEFPAGCVVPASEGVTRMVQDVVAKATLADIGVEFIGVCDNVPYTYYVLVEIDGRVPLEGMKVNTGILATLAPKYSVVVFCQKASGNAYDIAYRMFAPTVGINEDPVCGSANSFAAAYWAERTATASGNPIRIRAASTRGGDIELVWEEGTNTAKIRGKARVASKGDIYI